MPTTIVISTDSSLAAVFEVFHEYELGLGAKLNRANSWKGRKLSYQGKPLFINAIALSQIWHLCAVFCMPCWVASRLDKRSGLSFGHAKRIC